MKNYSGLGKVCRFLALSSIGLAALLTTQSAVQNITADPHTSVNSAYAQTANPWTTNICTARPKSVYTSPEDFIDTELIKELLDQYRSHRIVPEDTKSPGYVYKSLGADYRLLVIDVEGKRDVFITDPSSSFWQITLASNCDPRVGGDSCLEWEKNERNYIGLNLNPSYCSTTLKREGDAIKATINFGPNAGSFAFPGAEMPSNLVQLLYEIAADMNMCR